MLKIFENDYIIIYDNKKNYDFIYTIENKKNYDIIINIINYDEKINIYDWIGLFNNDKYIINEILQNNYKIIGG